MKTAVSEAVTNCVVHAYGDAAPSSFVSMAMTLSDHEATVVIEDTGRGIEDIEKARQPFSRRLPRRNARAWAFPSWRPSWTP